MKKNIFIHSILIFYRKTELLFYSDKYMKLLYKEINSWIWSNKITFSDQRSLSWLMSTRGLELKGIWF